MIQHQPRRSRTQLWTKPVAALVIGSMTLPTLAGCGGNAAQQASAPPLDATTGQAPMRPSGSMGGQRPGMSGKQKMVLLAGAAALYYMYKKKRDANNQPTNVQYYMSKNGRIYYRNPQTKQAVWVTAPARGFQVPANEASEFERFQGYNNGTNGVTDLRGMIPSAPGM